MSRRSHSLPPRFQISSESDSDSDEEKESIKEEEEEEQKKVDPIFHFRSQPESRPELPLPAEPPLVDPDPNMMLLISKTLTSLAFIWRKDILLGHLVKYSYLNDGQRPHPESLEMYYMFSNIPYVGFYMLFTLFRIQLQLKRFDLTIYQIADHEQVRAIFIELVMMFFSEARMEYGSADMTRITMRQRVATMQRYMCQLDQLLFFQSSAPSPTVSVVTLPVRSVLQSTAPQTKQDLVIKMMMKDKWLVQACFLRPEVDNIQNRAHLTQVWDLAIIEIGMNGTLLLHKILFIRYVALLYMEKRDTQLGRSHLTKLVKQEIVEEKKQIEGLFNQFNRY